VHRVGFTVMILVQSFHVAGMVLRGLGGGGGADVRKVGSEGIPWKRKLRLGWKHENIPRR
jgi:hypothetical protein